MKNILIIIFAVISLSSYGQGVNFEHISLEQAQKLAEKQNKFVFIDCYTTWCGPCKMMAKSVFPTKKMGDYLNPKYVCLKFEVSSGVGRTIADKYKVKSYPTFLILSPEGELVAKVSGGAPADPFISMVEDAMNPDNNHYLCKLKAKSDPTLNNIARAKFIGFNLGLVSKKNIQDFVEENSINDLITCKYGIASLLTILQEAPQEDFVTALSNNDEIIKLANNNEDIKKVLCNALEGLAYKTAEIKNKSYNEVVVKKTKELFPDTNIDKSVSCAWDYFNGDKEKALKTRLLISDDNEFLVKMDMYRMILEETQSQDIISMVNDRLIKLYEKFSDKNVWQQYQYGEQYPWLIKDRQALVLFKQGKDYLQFARDINSERPYAKRKIKRKFWTLHNCYDKMD